VFVVVFFTEACFLTGALAAFAVDFFNAICVCFKIENNLIKLAFWS
jgi:hypothetical protein